MSRTNATLGGVLLLGLGLAACAASQNGAPATGSSAAADQVYQVTMSANSADFRLVAAITSSNHITGLNSTASGSYSWAAGEGAYTVQGTDPGLYALTSQVVVDGKHEYSKITSKSGPASNSLVPGSGNGWTEFTISGGAAASAQDLFSQGLADMGATAIAQPEDINPATLLTILQSESGAVTNLGQVTLDGVPTTHYRTIVPLSKLGLGQAGVALGGSGATVDYWVDSGKRLRQLQMIITIPAQQGQSQPPATPAGGTSGQGTAPMYAVGTGTPEKYPLTFAETLQLSDYGTPAQIAVPPPSEVTGHQSCTVTSDGEDCQSG